MAPRKTTTRKVAPKTYVNVILDESGSMYGLQDTATEGYNKYLTELQSLKTGAYLVTLTKFNTVTKVLEAAVPLKKASKLTSANYKPGGMTALYDAIGHCVKAMEPKVKKGDRVLNVIITDGEENSSREFTKASIETLIKEREAKGNWTFTYLSAAPTAFRDAQGLGISLGNTMSYTPTSIGTTDAFQRMSRSTVMYASAQGMSSTKSFYQDDVPEPPPTTDTVVPALKAKRRVLK